MARRAGFHRRRLSLTSLIDVIFLLLLFFMLSSTFSQFSELELAAAGEAGEAAPARPVFIRLGPGRLSLDTREVTLATLPAALSDLVAQGDGPVPALISTGAGVSAQRLADLLVVLRGVPGLRVQILTPT